MRTSDGLLHSINVSGGGVPKRPTESCRIRAAGLEGDRQRYRRFHGGPQRAVSLYSLELIQALQSEGHPIGIGTIGENLTLAGVGWEEMIPGARVDIGEVSLKLTSYAAPCKTISASFIGGVSGRISQKAHPGWSRLYALVVVEGLVRAGDRVQVIAPVGRAL